MATQDQRATSNPEIGLKVFGGKTTADDIVDIIFIHDLTEDRISAWTHEPSETCWPEHLLPKSLPQARVMTFGYDGDVTNFLDLVSKNRVKNHADKLVLALANKRDITNTNDRAIIFVVHGLGGVICEDAILSSKNSAEAHIQGILECTRGIAFLGTPHHGADPTNWGITFKNLARSANPDIVNVLKPESEVLARIQSEFHTMIRARRQEGKTPINITCFYEELPVRAVGVIVPKHSAILPEYTSASIYANHKDMTKFESAEADGYEVILGELLRWTRAVEKDAVEKQAMELAVRPTPAGRVGLGWTNPPGNVFQQSSNFGGVNITRGGTIFQGNLASGGGNINIG